MDKSPKAYGRASAVSEVCLASRVRLLGRVVTALFQRELDPYGVTVSQFNILTALLRTGRTSPSRLSAMLRLEKSTLSRNLLLLNKSGWTVTEERGRTVEVEISPRGEKLYETAFAGWKRAQDRARRLLGRAGMKAINEAVVALDEV